MIICQRSFQVIFILDNVFFYFNLDIAKNRTLNETIRVNLFLDSFKFTADTGAMNAQIMVNSHFLSELTGDLLLTAESVMNIKIKTFYEKQMLNFNFDAKSVAVDVSFADQKWGRFIDLYLNQYMQEGFSKFLETNVYSILKESVKINDGAKFEIRYIENRGILLIIKSLKSLEATSAKREFEERRLKFLA